MNMHVPQNSQAKAEVKYLFAFENNIVTPQRNAPVCGIIQDGLVASYLLTNNWSTGPTLVRWNIFLDCIEYCGINIDLDEFAQRAYPHYPNSFVETDDGLDIAEFVEGKVLISAILPKNLCYSKNTGTNTNYPKVKIQAGIILPNSGPLCKKVIGAKANSIIHFLCRQYSDKKCIDFISALQKLTDRWLPSHGFSFGFSDCVCDDQGRTEILKEIANAERECLNILDRLDLQQDDKENMINGRLNSLMSVGDKLANQYMAKGERNSMNIMAICGAKGSVTNLCQIVGLVGQQNVDKKRIALSISGGTRTLPHFQFGDNTPEARGCVYNNYLQGLNPYELFFHAAGGRRGIIDTAIKTSDSGYIQKKIVKKSEDLVVRIDGSVRDHNDNIIQFLYGGDGMDAQKLIYNDGLSHPLFVNIKNLAQTLSVGHKKTRELCLEEINAIADCLHVGNPATQTDVTRRATLNLRKNVKYLLRDVKIAESKILDFSELIYKGLCSALAVYGYMAGLTASSSIGETTTQMTLNSFHFSGMGNKEVTLGVPRLNELLNAAGKSKPISMPSCTIYIIDEELDKLKAKSRENDKDESIKKKCINLMNSYISDYLEISVGSICKTNILRIDETDENLNFLRKYSPEWWVKLFQPELQPYYFVIQLTVDITTMFKYQLELSEIADAITEKIGDYGVCVVSPNCIGKIDIYIDYENVYVNVVDESELTDISTYRVYVHTRDYIINTTLKPIKIRGISGISKVTVREDLATKDWVLDTKGSKFLDILAHPSTDFTRTVTNDIWETYNILGIEATRSLLIEEMTRVISFDGTYVNPRHIELLVDTMLVKNKITSVNRDGLDKNLGPLYICSFEKHMDNMMDASLFGVCDTMRSLSSSVIYGTTMGAGTGAVDVRRS